MTTLLTRKVQDEEYAFLPIGNPKIHGIISIGINVVALEAIGSALSGDEEALAQYTGEPGKTRSRMAETLHSIFPDGTFFGIIDREAHWGRREFRL